MSNSRAKELKLLQEFMYVKCDPVTGPVVAQRVGRGIALLFHDRGTGQQHAPAALYLREGPGTHFTGSWVGPRDGVDGRKISLQPECDPRPSRVHI